MGLFVCVFKLADDRMALVSGISLDPEAAIGVTKKLPPKWVEGVDEVKLKLGTSYIKIHLCALYSIIIFLKWNMQWINKYI